MEKLNETEKSALWKAVQGAKNVNTVKFVISMLEGAHGSFQRCLKAVEKLETNAVRFMGKHTNGITVMNYRVASSNGGAYPVELMYDSLNSMFLCTCGCEDWQENNNSALQKKEMYFCKHIMACMWSSHESPAVDVRLIEKPLAEGRTSIIGHKAYGTPGQIVYLRAKGTFTMYKIKVIAIGFMQDLSKLSPTEAKKYKKNFCARHCIDAKQFDELYPKVWDKYRETKFELIPFSK